MKLEWNVYPKFFAFYVASLYGVGLAKSIESNENVAMYSVFCSRYAFLTFIRYFVPQYAMNQIEN